MLPIARRHAHYLFAIIQSGLTTFIASGIATMASAATGRVVANWLLSWITAWIVMLPVVVFAAPFIRRAAIALTRE